MFAMRDDPRDFSFQQVVAVLLEPLARIHGTSHEVLDLSSSKYLIQRIGILPNFRTLWHRNV